MHSRLEMYASRLAQVEYGGTGSNSTPDSDDEHQLIAQYCQALPGTSNGSAPKSPVQVMAAMDAEQREELEAKRDGCIEKRDGRWGVECCFN